MVDIIVDYKINELEKKLSYFSRITICDEYSSFVGAWNALSDHKI